jgi:hypothetical protein
MHNALLTSASLSRSCFCAVSAHKKDFGVLEKRPTVQQGISNTVEGL